MYNLQIVYIVFILLHICIFTLNVVKSYRIIQNRYYNTVAIVNGIISLLPVGIYSISCITYSNNLTIAATVMPFFIEWIISIPLLLLNSIQFIKMNTCQRILMYSMSTAMTLLGYGSAISTDIYVSAALFIISSLCYLSLLLILYVHYFISYNHIRKEQVAAIVKQNNLVVFRAIAFTISITWNGYPIVFILWKYDIIGLEGMVAGFIVFDFITNPKMQPIL